eukprot:6462369-Amphidinium_carterae.1
MAVFVAMDGDSSRKVSPNNTICQPAFSKHQCLHSQCVDHVSFLFSECSMLQGTKRQQALKKTRERKGAPTHMYTCNCLFKGLRSTISRVLAMSKAVVSGCIAAVVLAAFSHLPNIENHRLQTRLS